MRDWNELVAAWGDIVPLPLTALLLLLAAGIVGTLWFFWPSWWHAMLRIRFRRRPKRAKKKDEAVRVITDDELDDVAESDEELPEVAPVVFVALADRFAAEGRYAEAVRERLRAMVREMVERGVVVNRPGWTVTELAEAASAALPGVRPPLTAASGIFSLIWYRKSPARIEDDSEMRVLADQLHTELSRR
ncbi:DUF4129 domain-containing protein [Allorhizocola rhizosphaerae]|uniref:DUF4129 domain-containing protein n=1 Tax=Allorhizocola rhizosphaerae TaxID=1872709 RepID=UPI000E3D3CAD|nr:DUF4129 domain-containing protein [Allorhizocola rhizosphaerae]